jgi:hypothetical protein
VAERTERHVLADGTSVVVRPLLYGDRFELAARFQELSARSRRLRFLNAPESLDREDVEYLTNIDHEDHVALAAFVDEGGPVPVGVGVARYIRDADDPTAAEVAVTVVDAYQRRGLGTLLTRILAGVAAGKGIRTFVSYVLWENTTVLDLLADEGARIASAEPGIARVEVDVPAQREQLHDSSLRRILHAFADGLLDVLGGVGVGAGGAQGRRSPTEARGPRIPPRRARSTRV